TYTIARTVTPANVPPAVHVFNVSCTDKLAKRLTTQNPESLGSERPIPPAQIANPSSNGDAPKSAAIGPNTVEAVISAKVVFPSVARRICENKNASNKIGILQPVITSTKYSPIPLLFKIAPKLPPAPLIKIINPPDAIASLYNSLGFSFKYGRNIYAVTNKLINNAVFFSPINIIAFTTTLS